MVVERPEETAELWRRSRESYRTVLASSPRYQSAERNLALVENRLAHLLHRLGKEAFQVALDKPRTSPSIGFAGVSIILRRRPAWRLMNR